MVASASHSWLLFAILLLVSFVAVAASAFFPGGTTRAFADATLLLPMLRVFRVYERVTCIGDSATMFEIKRVFYDVFNKLSH